jgi:hypothetical protein
MAKKNERHIFNLLQPLKPPPTVWDKIYDWLVKRARVIIMIAEVFIAIAFFSKVIVDTQAKDKQEDIDALIAETRLYTDENGTQNARKLRYQELQSRSGDYEKLWDGSSNAQEILNELYSYIPNQTSSLSVNYEAGRISITGEVELSILESIEDQIDASDTFQSSEITLVIEQDDAAAGIGTYSLEAVIADDIATRENINN